MCGRFTLRTPAKDVGQLFDVNVPELEPRYNVAPSQDLPAVRLDGQTGQREFALLRWGLVPFWADDPKTGYSLINARAETVAQKRSFRAAFRKRRCLILADGFYEWQKPDGKTKGKKQPYFIHMVDDRPFAFAGLWERWKRDGEEVESCTIIVTEANDLVTPFHDRMPVILPPEDYDLWLDGEFADESKLQSMLRPYPSHEMEAYPVAPVVNSPKNDRPECIERLAE